MSVNYALDSELIADWIELTLLSRSDNSIGFDKLRQTTCEELELPEQRIDVAINLMKRRAGVLNESYPFEIRSVGVVRNFGWDELPYTFLLRISSGIEHNFSLSTDYTNSRVTAFEDLVVLASRSLLGRDGKALRFGFPSEDRPVEFPKAIEWLSQRMGIRPGQAFRPPRRKDGGVDVVAWRPFKDGRNGFPVYLIQVTCERNYSHKVFDIDLRLWSGWLNLDTDPTSVLAVPTTISPGEEWNEISSKVIILERIRICELLSPLNLKITLSQSTNRSSWEFSLLEFGN